MKTLKLVTLIICAHISVTSFAQFPEQNFIYINTNNNVQTTTPTKSFQYVGGVTLSPGFSVVGTSTTWYVRPVDVVNTPQSLDKSFVRTETILTPIASESSISTLSVLGKSTQYDYTDDLGRSLQQVSVKSSPLQNDMITLFEYDVYGRQPKVYLPYSILNRNGSFRAAGTTTEVFNFYSGTAKVAQDSKPFKFFDFDNSTLNQVRTAYGPGNDWQANAKSVQTIMNVDVTGTILKWKYISDIAPPTISSYPAKTVTTSDVTDEQGVVSREYKDYRGLTILSIRDATSGSFKTYNVYDISGNLMLVIPPEAADRISTEYTAAGVTDVQRMDFLNRWAFQYVYDVYGRQIKKRAPGASDWTLMVYDQWDRVVLTREPAWTTNQWLFTKYDIFSRPIMSGIYTTSTAFDVLRTNAMAATVHHEDAVPSNVTGYNFTTTFPTGVSEGDLRSVTYYDNYNFIYSGWDAEGFTYTYTGAGKQDPVKGYTTGSKVRVLGSTRWLNTVTYYDNKYRTLYTIGENYNGGTDKITNVYDFPGKLTTTTHVHTSSLENITVLKEFFYDHAGRLQTEYQTIGNTPRTLIVSNAYNELGQLVEKNLHSVGGSAPLQSVDYRYNIRGWVTNINNSTLTSDASNDDTNDLFGIDYLFNQSETINGVTTTPNYNGNISAIRWKINNLIDAPKEKVFGFTYDKLNRLSNNKYAEKASGTWSTAVDMYKESMTYDRNGNIRTLGRWMNYNGVTTQVDNLTYKYGTNTAADNWGNKLYNVHDNSIYYNSADKNPAYGYSETMHDPALQEYTYDNSGRMLTDQNREITGGITYNYLNMPELIQMSGNRRIEYTYDAAGNKLRTVVKDTNGNIEHQTDYVGSFYYVNNVLTFINHSEGRAVKNNTGGFDYEYHLKDHQDNTRVVFGYLKETKEYRATMEVALAYKEKYENDPVNGFRNMPSIPPAMLNHTAKSAEIIVADRSAETNGSVSTKIVGPAKMIQVGANDRLQLEVFGRYNSGTGGSSSVVSALATAVTGAFGLLPGEAAHTALTNGVPSPMAAVSNPQLGVPKAYLCYFLFDNSYAPKQFGYAPISSTAATQHERLFIDATMPYAGYVYVYVVNESTVSAASVYFDDLKIVHEKNNPTLQVTQTSDYLPFGLSFNEYYQSRAGNTNVPYSQNKYKFQGQEQQNGQDLGWYHFKYRMHDPAIGRFHLVDPLADEYAYNSTYAFSENRLIDGVELEGKEFAGSFSTMYSSYVYNYRNDVDGGYTWGAVSMGGDAFSYMGTGIRNWFYNGSVGAVNKMSTAENQLRVEDRDYKNSTGIYREEMGMTNTDKLVHHTLTQSGNAAEYADGFSSYYNTTINVPMGLVLGGLEANVASNLFRTPQITLGVVREGSSIQANRTAGNLFRDELAAALRAEGRTVHTEAYKWTPFGKRYMDLDVWHNGINLGGIETKVGGSRYLPLQRLKDAWLGANDYPVQLVRKPTGW